MNRQSSIVVKAGVNVLWPSITLAGVNLLHSQIYHQKHFNDGDYLFSSKDNNDIC